MPVRFQHFQSPHERGSWAIAAISLQGTKSSCFIATPTPRELKTPSSEIKIPFHWCDETHHAPAAVAGRQIPLNNHQAGWPVFWFFCERKTRYRMWRDLIIRKAKRDRWLIQQKTKHCMFKTNSILFRCNGEELEDYEGRFSCFDIGDRNKYPTCPFFSRTQKRIRGTRVDVAMSARRGAGRHVCSTLLLDIVQFFGFWFSKYFKCTIACQVGMAVTNVFSLSHQ